MALQNVEANITLDLYNHDTTPATVKAIQLDSQTRYVAAMLQSMGTQYDVDSGATVQLIVIRPDKVGVQIVGTTFTYGDEGAQFLGPYAELTQVALAVNGKMRGQFKITSGDQILRTEIFAISNGEALDASTDEWADEYDGYNLEEMATSIETNTADIATLEADVSQIKEDFTNTVNSAYVTNSASGAIAHFEDGADNVPMKSVKVNIAPVQSGSGDPSPDNVRPISGWTEVDVEQSGKNLANLSFSYKVPSIYTGKMVPNTGWSTDFIRVFQNCDYIASFQTQHTNYVMFYDANKSYLGYRNSSSGVYSPNSNAYWSQTAYVKLRVDGTKNESIKAQLELGSTATPYEPYTGRSITIQLGQTVYGGKLDVLSGVLSVEYDSFLLNDVVIGRVSYTSYNVFRIIPPHATLSGYTDGWCEVFKTLGDQATPNNWIKFASDYWDGAQRRIVIRADEFETVEAFKEQFGQYRVVYRLRDPITYNLTPTEVKSLLGINNIWSDAGDVDVEYRADTKLYIKRLTDSDTDMIADSNITSGQYFMVGNDLYRATVNIASGAQIVVGTNATKVSLSEALNEINA